ncbi:calcium-binding protein [Pelagibius marinus]|uniref:calcium-binding protein n=1 Tax=Pelagibius marinus TaxID=2762760 RepID=UPI0018726149|nr:calcium-binding protein [Pelagibius marinus]
MAILPNYGAAVFVPGAPVDNTYFPLIEGSVLSYSGSKVDEDSGETETESNDVFVTFETTSIDGVQVVVVHDTGYLDGVLIEDTLDYYAQDTDGNVWYLGELSYSYEYDDDGQYIATSTEGSWETGVDGALPGWAMPADPQVGDSYYQEFLAGEAEDEGLVLGTDEDVSIAFGDFDQVLQTQDTTALEPDVLEYKYYAPGVGQILTEEDIDEEGEPELSVELIGIRQTGPGALGEDVDHPDIEDFTPNSPLYVTYLGQEALYESALGAYVFDLETHEIGEGWILFDSSEDLEFGEQIEVDLEEGQGLGLFLISDVEDYPLDLSEFEEGGLYFQNFLTGEAATLDDNLAPLITDEEGVPLPIQGFHALGGEDGFNFLNPAAGSQATELDFDCLDVGGEDGLTVVGFEDLRITDPDFDGDYNDFLVAVSRDPAEDLLEFDDLIVGDNHNDHLIGGREDEILLGLGGNDRLFGGRGGDGLQGGDGDDRLFGGAGDDRLCGDDGDDWLFGGRGDDTLTGGAGDDRMNGGLGSDVFSFGLDEGDDIVYGFEADCDSIDLSATALTFQDLTIQQIASGTQIDLGAGSILLAGVQAPEIDETSFVF